MERRRFLLLLPASLTVLQASDGVARGKLKKAAGDQPALQTSDGKLLILKGDPDTMGVLKDGRLADADFEVVGQFKEGDRFNVNPIHTRALFAYKGNQRLMVTYWCAVCAIRTYTPGICWCCREETALDLIEPDKVVKE